MITLVNDVAFDQIHKNGMVIFYGLPVVGNMLLWYSNTNIRRGPPLRYKAYDTGEGRIGVFPCLPVSGKAVSELYREKIDALQAAESRLLAQRAAAQSAAAEQVRQAEKDGAALVAAAQEAARRDAADALRRAEAQADTERAAMLARTEQDCAALRETALGRMDGAVAYLLEKVVQR